MAELFKLPSSSYEEVVKIIMAYSGTKEGTVQTLDDIAQSTKIDRTIVSANNGFLVQMGIITEGNKKGTTDVGRLLGRAYTSKIEDEVERIWHDLISDNDFLNRMTSAVRIRGGMDKTEYINHIIYSSGQNANSRTRAGAGAIIEVLKVSGLLIETDGKLVICEKPDKKEIIEAPKTAFTTHANTPDATRITNNAGAVAININIDIACSAENIDGLAEKIKQFIKDMSDS